MSQHGDSPNALASARRALVARSADLAEADRALTDTIAGAQALAAESIGRIDAIGAELDSVPTDAPRDSPGAAHAIGRHLVAKNRDIAVIVSEARAAAHSKAVALKELTQRYR